MASGEQILQDDNHTHKCRIPQRLPPGKQKKTAERNKPFTYPEVVYIRPKSASRTKENTNVAEHFPVRSAHGNRERLSPAQKKPAQPLKKSFNENGLITGSKVMKNIITVPIASKQKPDGGHKSTFSWKPYSTLPDQETIKKCEDLESTQHEHADSLQMHHSESELRERDSITSRSENIMHLKVNWQDQIVKFENMKIDLNERQRTVVELYANLCLTHQKLNKLGHKASLPGADDLNLMNVAKMTPDQLLQLCSQTKRLQSDNQLLSKIPLDLDIKKLNNLPGKLIALCEETLKKRKDIIDWFDTLRTREKGCTVSSLTKKINEFNAENDMLHCSLDNVKSEFMKEMNEIFDFLRKCISKTVALQLRTEELTCTLSDIQSKNSDLRKQMYNADQCRSHNSRGRMEELEKQLKEEKLMRVTIRDRLSRAEGQVKIGENRAAQLEAALNTERMHTRNLERTVFQLKERNHTLQQEFDEELSKLNQSIKENTTHLEEIADAREKLQTERVKNRKEDLEKRLEELSNHYNESLDNIKQEQSRNIAKIIEIEKKYNDEIEERIKRDTQIEKLCEQLVESELRYKDTLKLLEEQKSLMNKESDSEKELLTLKNELKKSNADVEEYKQSATKKANTIKEMEKKLNESLASEEKLKNELQYKEKVISDLKTCQACKEEQLKNRDFKMTQYEEQLIALKNHLNELQEHWNDIDNLQLLPEMVNEQNEKVDDFSRQINDLTEALEKKNIEIKHLSDTLKNNEDIITQKEYKIRTLSMKEEEQANIIKLLRNNIEMRAHVDVEINRQLIEKNAEIDSLLTNLDNLKKQMNQLEKIILNLEDQIQKNSSLKRKDEEKIRLLEEKLNNYEVSPKLNNYEVSPSYTKNVDNYTDHILKILEEELDSLIETKSHRDQKVNMSNKNRRDNKRHPPNPMFYQESLKSEYYKNHDSVPTKIEMANFVKKTYVPNSNDVAQENGFQCNTDIYGCNMQECHPFRDVENVHTTPEFLINNNNIFAHFGDIRPLTYSDDRNITRNLQYFIPTDLKDEKKRKMFKLVGHKL